MRFRKYANNNELFTNNICEYKITRRISVGSLSCICCLHCMGEMRQGDKHFVLCKGDEIYIYNRSFKFLIIEKKMNLIKL